MIPLIRMNNLSDVKIIYLVSISMQLKQFVVHMYMYVKNVILIVLCSHVQAWPHRQHVSWDQHHAPVEPAHSHNPSFAKIKNTKMKIYYRRTHANTLS